MTPVITNTMRVQISAAAATLHPSVRQSFIAGVMRALSHSSHPTLNDTLRAIQLGLDMVPSSAIIVSRSVGKTTDDADDRRSRRVF
jgi:hypothetical protein